MRLFNWYASVLLVVGISTAVGCQNGFLQPPGPMDFQQSTALINDPFPLDDIGPSDLAARPPGFQQSLPEPVRNRLAKDTMPWLQIDGP